jgi:hypothetical protein
MKNIYFAAQSENLGLKKVSFKAPQTTKMRNAQNRSKDLCTPLSSALDSVYDLLASVSRHLIHEAHLLKQVLTLLFICPACILLD